MKTSYSGWTNLFGSGEEYADEGYRDEDGNPVRRTPQTHRYSYDTFVQWQHPKLTRRQADGDAYSDRLLMWDWDKYNEAHEAVWGNKAQYFYEGDGGDPKKVEQFLSLYLGKSVTLVTILQGCNQSSGYPVWFFRWKTNLPVPAVSEGEAGTPNA